MSPHYPFDEDLAGVLRDSHKTGKSTEAMMANKDVLLLGKEILTKDNYMEAEKLSNMLVGTKSEKNSARATLISVLMPPPKRPIYYLAHELEFLPRWTREAMRILGDYIDMLTKAAVFEMENNGEVFRISFGPAINRFKKWYPKEAILAEWLERYNRFLYRDAKHDFALPSTRKEHRFTSREVVLCVFITKQLSDKIKKLSSVAMKVSKDEPM
jgi:hypothetical protein